LFISRRAKKINLETSLQPPQSDGISREMQKAVASPPYLRLIAAANIHAFLFFALRQKDRNSLGLFKCFLLSLWDDPESKKKCGGAVKVSFLLSRSLFPPLYLCL
jgi:hypothetical protein